MTEKLTSEQLKVVKARVEAGYDNEDARYLLSHIAALEAELAAARTDLAIATGFEWQTAKRMVRTTLTTHPTSQTPKVE